MCNGIPNCPLHDDEHYCNDPECPENCSCNGHEFSCTGLFFPRNYTHLRYLDGSNSPIHLDFLQPNIFLVYLKLSACEISHLGFVTLPNLKVLLVDQNNIQTLPKNFTERFPVLEYLSLSSNPLNKFIEQSQSTLKQLLKLKILDMSKSQLLPIALAKLMLNPVNDKSVTAVKLLNLSFTTLPDVPSFKVLTNLENIDLTETETVKIPNDVFEGLTELQFVRGTNFKFCCPKLLPGQVKPQNCLTDADEVSSCESLLQNNIYKVFVWIFATLTIMGNFSSFVARTLLQKNSKDTGIAYDYCL